LSVSLSRAVLIVLLCSSLLRTTRARAHTHTHTHTHNFRLPLTSISPPLSLSLLTACERYSWWSSFFSHCMRKLPGWWEVKSSVAGRGSGSSFEAIVMPYVVLISAHVWFGQPNAQSPSFTAFFWPLQNAQSRNLPERRCACTSLFHCHHLNFSSLCPVQT
jgi:hypothetical protein